MLFTRHVLVPLTLFCEEISTGHSTVHQDTHLNSDRRDFKADNKKEGGFSLMLLLCLLFHYCRQDLNNFSFFDSFTANPAIIIIIIPSFSTQNTRAQTSV